MNVARLRALSLRLWTSREVAATTECYTCAVVSQATQTSPVAPIPPPLAVNSPVSRVRLRGYVLCVTRTEHPQHVKLKGYVTALTVRGHLPRVKLKGCILPGKCRGSVPSGEIKGTRPASDLEGGPPPGQFEEVCPSREGAGMRSPGETEGVLDREAKCLCLHPVLWWGTGTD